MHPSFAGSLLNLRGADSLSTHSLHVAATTLRTHRCGALRLEHAGQRVMLGGWVHRRRNLGGMIFLDVRDREGLVQVAVGPDWSTDETLHAAATVPGESVVLVEGDVVARPPAGRNPDLPTGDIEVQAQRVVVVGPATTPPIPVARARGEELAAEELRLKHRHLDLRRPEMIANLTLRHRLLQQARATLAALEFVEIETPILTRPTPEGARDFLVPSRIHAGECYALPQSPQIYKQLLMVAGYDRYFQIARCFRDEDLRADRQPEFTQIDLEASFVAAEDVYGVVERLLVALWGEAGHEIEAPFQRMKYREALERYGTDKPDLRFGLPIEDLTPEAKGWGLGFLARSLEDGGRVRALRLPPGSELSRRDVDALIASARASGLGGLAWARREGDRLAGSLAKQLSVEQTALDDGAVLLLAAGPDHLTSPALDRVRTEAIRRLAIPPSHPHRFVWIDEFPLFEPDPETGVPVFAHHPFTAPHPDDAARLESAPLSCRALHYDIVYNGTELGSGSIRITDPALQRVVFRCLGLDDDDAEQRFGFLLTGLAAGAPPHGGIALGFDRISMLLAGAPSLREVIAFPKTTAARALFEGAPAPVSDGDWASLHLRLTE